MRASYGIFYTSFQGLSAGIMYGVPPYGYNYLSPAPPLFATPFISADDGTNNGQRFPLVPPPLNASPSNPVTSVNWRRQQQPARHAELRAGVRSEYQPRSDE